MPRVSDEYRAARRDQILRAAMVCAAEQGFHKTTMSDVIARSGLSAGAVYGYFKGKTEIIEALVEHVLGVVSLSIDELVADGHPPSIPELIGHVGGEADRQAEILGVDLTRVMVAAWAEAVRDEAVREVAAPKVRGLRSRVAGLLGQLQKEGRWDPDADPELVARAVIGLIPGFILQRLILRDVQPDRYELAVRGLLSGQQEPAKHSKKPA